MVRMAPKLTFGGASADWQERINFARMREKRAERAGQIMRKYGLPVMLEASPTNIRYLTGTKGFENPIRLEDAVVVTKNGAELIDHFPREEILEAPR